MQVVILAGGYGTRLSEYTDKIPKPMVKIGNKPILEHIIRFYLKFGFKDFIVPLGYKGSIIKNYFKSQKSRNLLSKINLKLVDTGLGTMTGGRVKRIERFIKSDNFFLTYGDGLSDINIENLLKMHLKEKAYVTVTAVHPIARFGEIILSKNKVTSFKEKPQIQTGWINGGFFVMNRKIFNFIKDDQTVLEKEPLEKICKLGKLNAFKHEGFWQCMDTKREKDQLEEIYKKNKKIWY
tara:strand:- start:2239 stop:2949 length:711 start_codon:yes stop_codon:yes gene_type:complete